MKKIILILLLTPVLSYAVSSGTFTLRETGGDFASLSLAEAGLQGNLISTVTLNIDQTWTSSDTTPVTITGWTTYSTAPFIIQAINSGRHAGVWDDTKYKFSPRSTDITALTLVEKFIEIDGLQIEPINTNVDSNAFAIAFNQNTAGTRYKISNCILRHSFGDKNDNAQAGIYAQVGNLRSEYYFWNNIIYNFGIGIRQDGSTSGTTWYIYNNTFYKTDYSGTGITIQDDYNPNHLYLRMKNNIVEGSVSTTTCYNFRFSSNFIDFSSACNVSSDNTSPNTEYRFQKALFVATTDFHLLTTDTTSYAKGRNLSADPLLAFNTDNANAVRPLNWSINAIDISTPTVVVATQRRMRFKRPLCSE
jgi:hypothetical protein